MTDSNEGPDPMTKELLAKHKQREEQVQLIIDKNNLLKLSAPLLIGGLIESARCLGIYQEKVDQEMAEYWEDHMEAYRLALSKKITPAEDVPIQKTLTTSELARSTYADISPHGTTIDTQAFLRSSSGQQLVEKIKKIPLNKLRKP